MKERKVERGAERLSQSLHSLSGVSHPAEPAIALLPGVSVKKKKRYSKSKNSNAVPKKFI